jgi:glycosyltransferase involved in cell wall biosynthesis
MTTVEPPLSAVVCSIGRARPEETLESIQASVRRAGLECELILVWQANTEPGPLPTDTRVARVFPSGHGYARNRGLALAGAPLVAFVDDDEIVHEAWAAALTEGFRNLPGLTGLFGPVLPRDDLGLPYCVQPDTPTTTFGPGTPPWLVGTGGNMAYARERLLEAGGFDALFGSSAVPFGGEDHELIVRLLRRGHLLAYSPEMAVYHPTKAVEERLASRFPYGYSAGKVARRHRDARLAARYGRNATQVIVGAARRRDERRLREGVATLHGFLRGVVFRSRALSPVQVLDQIPAGIPAAAETLRPLPLRLRADPHYLYATDDQILHVYVNPAPSLPAALELREQVRGETGLPGIPGLTATASSTDALWVLEERLTGDQPRARSVGRWFPGVAEWSIRLAGHGGPKLGETQGWENLRSRLLGHCPPELIGVLEDALRSIAPLPSRRSHGDLDRKNILIDRGAVGVLDWEFFRADGIPGRDLLQLAVVARDGRPDPSVVAGLASGGEVPWGSVRPYLARAGLPEESLRPMLVVLLVFWAMHEADRLATPGWVYRDAPYRGLLEACRSYLV